MLSTVLREGYRYGGRLEEGEVGKDVGRDGGRKEGSNGGRERGREKRTEGLSHSAGLALSAGAADAPAVDD